MYLKHKAHFKPSLQIVADLNTIAIDLDATIMKICIKKYQLTNVLVDEGFGINIMTNYI